MSPQKKYTLSEARIKAQEYCVYRERCHQEVKDKLFSWGLPADHVDAIMYELIQLNFLNEERYTESFVSGKLNIKHWGRHKIKQALVQKGVGELLIRQKLEAIDDEEYFSILRQTVQKKWRLTSAKNHWEKIQKLKRYLFSRGFEAELIEEVIQDFQQE